jgi:hypothetical protein
MRRAEFFVAILGLIVVPGAALLGQEITGAISGMVHDPAGAVMAGVTLTAKETQSGLTRTVVTTETGSYRIPALPIGEYEVSAQVSGFKQAVQRGISVAVAQESVANLTLQVGDVSQEVTVQADAQLVNTTVTSTSGLVASQQVADLPLNGRSFLDLVTLNSGSVSNRSNTSNGDAPSYSIAGNRPDQARFTLNGIDYVGNSPVRIYTAPQGISGFLLGVDAVQEFNVLEHTYGADYGKRAGAQVNIVTKSGTNQLHGSAFEYFRNNALNTRNYFSSVGVPPLQRNQFGAALGGPVRHDKLFVFGNYEGYRDREGSNIFGYVPDQQVRQGLLPNASGQYVTVSGLQPAILPFFQYWPLPNGPELFQNGLPTGIASYTASPKQAVNENFWLARADYYLSKKDTVSSNTTVDRGARSVPAGLFITNNETDLYTTSTQETHVFTPSLLNLATFGFSRGYADQIVPPINPFPTSLLLLNGPSRNQPGSLTINGLGLLGASGANLASVDRRNISVADDVKWTKGIHGLSIGGTWGTVSQLAYSTTTNNSGTATYPTLTAFLQDKPTQLQVLSNPTPLNVGNKIGGVYAQDEIKLRPNLTVRVGLRVESSNMVTVDDNHAANYRVVGTTLETLPFIGGTPLLANNAKALWEPRVGLAWDPTGTGKWSIRAGAGMYDDLLQDNLANRLIRNPPFNGLVSFSGQSMLSLIPLASNLQPPPQCTAIGQANCTIYAPSPIDTNLHIPTVQQWSLTVERQLTQSLKLETAYVGSQSYHLPQAVDMNSIQPQTCNNPSGCLAGGVLAASSQAIVPQGTYYIPAGARPNPLLSTAVGWLYDGTGNYHSLHLSVVRRLTHGLAYKVNYTWGKAIDTNSAITAGANTNGTASVLNRFNRGQGRGPASFSVNNQFNAHFSYQLPFGKGKAFLSGANGLVDRFVGGWQWNSIITWDGGFPMTLGAGQNRTGDGNTNNVVDVVSLNPGYSGNPILGTDGFKTTGKYFDPKAFLLPTAGTYGNLGRGVYTGPRLFNVDTSFFKQIPLKERLNLQFRAELFNVLNHTNFSLPSAAVFSGTAISPTAGTINSTVGTSRQIQFALRLQF